MEEFILDVIWAAEFLGNIWHRKSSILPAPCYKSSENTLSLCPLSTTSAGLQLDTVFNNQQIRSIISTVQYTSFIIMGLRLGKGEYCWPKRIWLKRLVAKMLRLMRNYENSPPLSLRNLKNKNQFAILSFTSGRICLWNAFWRISFIFPLWGFTYTNLSTIFD